MSLKVLCMGSIFALLGQTASFFVVVLSGIMNYDPFPV